MSLPVTCRRCGRSFAATPHLYGQTVACPVCGAALSIPNPGAPMIPGYGAVPPAGNVSSNVAPYGPPVLPPGSSSEQTLSTRSSNKPLIVLISVLSGGLMLFVVCSGALVMWTMRGLSRPQLTEFSSLIEARRGFQTSLIRRERAGVPATPPPPALLQFERYPSPAGELGAYVSPPPGDGRKRPAIIWVFGGFDNSIGETAWEPATPDNDQSASKFREAGLVMMYPSFRGGNMNPGHVEAFYGEVDDLLAAADYLARKEYVDPQRIYLGGHSTGGTLVMLAAAATNRFRAVFAFGPVDEVAGYGPDVLPFDQANDREFELRNPIQWLHAMRGPLFVIEGTRGNIRCLRSMRRASTNPQHHFCEARGADHFGILAPLTALLAEKIQQDNGTTCNIQLTEDEIGRRLAR